MPTPPLPPGFTLDSPEDHADLLKPLFDAGVVPTNGFRTPADVERLRAAGYHPAEHTKHLDGDAVDLVPGQSGLTRGQLREQAASIASGWPGGHVLDEGDHIHLQLPGWGQAPGTPGTKNAGMPPLPPGFTLTQRGSLMGGNYDPRLAPAPQAPAPLPDVQPTPQEQADAAALFGKPSGLLNAMTGPPDIPAPPAPSAPQGQPQPPQEVVWRFQPGDKRKGRAFTPAPLPDALGASYRTQTDPALNDQLEAVYEHGAGVEGIYQKAAELGLKLNAPIETIRAWVHHRDAEGGRERAFVPADAHIAVQDVQGPPTEKFPGESTEDFIKRGGQVWDGPVTPEHPFGRTVRERTEKIFRDMGYSDAPERADLAGQLPTPLMGGYAWDEAQKDLRTGHYAGAVFQGSMAGLGLLPVGPGAGLKAGAHWVDSVALRVAATVDGEAPSVARAGEALATSVEDALNAGGTVTLHAAGETREIVGFNQAGELVDHAGATVHPEQLARHMLAPPAGTDPRIQFHIPSLPETPRAAVRGEALASDLPQEAPNEAIRLGGGREPPAPPSEPPAPGGPFQPPEVPRQRDYLDMPPLPRGFTLDMPGEQSALGFSGRMNEPRSAEEMAALARNAQPEAFAPVPSSLVRTEAEAMRANPDTMRAIEPPEAVGRAPAAPATFADTLKAQLKADSKAKGMPVRIDAEHAIDSGVSADLVYLNPNVADKTKLRLRFPSIFGTRFGKMTGKQQHLISLDMDGVDPVAWGFDHKAGQRLDPEDIGDLLRRSLEGDPSAFQRGEAFDAWTAHHEAEARRAEFEGRFPDGAPVERTGSPATLSDLRANEPPATSYEDLLASGKSRVANINLGNIRTRQDVQRALEATEAHFGGFDAARRGTMSHAETQALASELGMTVEDLLRRRQGQALNAEQGVAARTIHAKSLDELTSIARDMSGRGLEHWTPAEKEQFAQHLVTHAKIYEQVTAATAEAGRALSAHRITADARAFSQQIHRLTAATGRGETSLEDVARLIVNLQKQGVGPGGISRFAMEAAKPARPIDMLLELFYNSILSAPSTHVINSLGNTVSQAMSVPEYGLAALLGKVRGGNDRVLGAEVGGYVDGLLHGVGKGSEAFRSAIKTGAAGTDATKLDVVRHRAIPGLAGKIIRTPTRFLVAEDEFFKGIARQGALGRLAARQGVKEGLTGKALAARIAELRANPTDAMTVQAREFARYMTFQREPGRLGKALQAFTDDHPALKFLIPFVRTQENLVKFAAERSPVAFLMPSVRADLRAGGAKRDLAIAKIAIGSAIGFVVYEAARRGIITGGEPADAGTRNLLHASGWQPYSIKVGGRYISYRRLDPLSLTMSVAADLATYDKYMTDKEREHGAAIVAQMMSRNLSNSFWMESVSNIMKLVGDPLKEAPNQAANIVGALAVPNIIAQPTASMDPVERVQSAKDANWFRGVSQTILNRVKGRIPGLRQTLPVRQDAFGEPVRNDGRLGPDILSPFQQRLVNPDPTYQNLLDSGLRVDQPGGTVNRVPLTRAQHADYTRLSGRYIKDDMAAMQRDPDYRRLSPADRKARFEQIKRDARADARADLGLDGLSPGDTPPLPPGYSQDGPQAAPQRKGRPMLPPPPPGFTVDARR